MKKILTTVDRKTQFRDRELLEAEEELEREENVAEKDTFFKTDDLPVEEKPKKMVLRDGRIWKEPKPDRFKNKPHSQPSVWYDKKPKKQHGEDYSYDPASEPKAINQENKAIKIKASSYRGAQLQTNSSAKNVVKHEIFD